MNLYVYPKRLFRRTVAILNRLALLSVAQTANTACLWMFFQPEEPKEAKKYRRF